MRKEAQPMYIHISASNRLIVARFIPCSWACFRVMAPVHTFNATKASSQ